MRRLQILIWLVLLTIAPILRGQTDAMRYVVTLKEDGPAAAMEQLAIRYGGRVDPLASGNARQFAVIMTPSGAQLLGGDPGVTAVVPEATAASLTGRLHPATETYGSDGSSGTYSYDGSGNIIGIGADTFRYDAEGRLVRAIVRGVQEDYVYDAFGNRTSATGATNCLGTAPCTAPVSVSPSTNHLTNSDVSYDAAGSVTAASGANYSYDGTGMMTRSIAGSDDRQYVYTADDERIAVRQGLSWNWSVRDLRGKVLREYTSTEGASLTQTGRQWIKDYIWRDGLLLASTDATGTYHYHLDHLGTPRLITDANHVRVAEHAYYPFGSEISITPHESTEEPMKFTGHERDIVAGGYLTLDYMHARYYSSSLGRFLSVDPMDGSAHKPQSWNRYTYVEDNPMKFTDADGRQASITVIAPQPVIDPVYVAEKEHEFRLWVISNILYHIQNGYHAFDRKAKEFDHMMAFLVRSKVGFDQQDCGTDAECADVLYQMGGVYDVGGEFSDAKFAAQLEKQLAKDGVASVEKSIASLEKRLVEHEAKVGGLKYKSSVEREIRTFRRQIETAKQFLRSKGLM
jgi:RHS repeat-associated protein